MDAPQNQKLDIGMIGTSPTGMILAFQHEARTVLKATKGDMSGIIEHILSGLHERGAFGAEDLKLLEAGFSEALDVLARKRTPSSALGSARQRHASMVANPKSSDVARALAELCQSVIGDAAVAALDAQQPGVAKLVASTTITGRGDQALLWGAVGAGFGATIGGAPGAIIGAVVGAAIGACGDGPTTVSVQNNGGGGSGGHPA